MEDRIPVVNSRSQQSAHHIIVIVNEVEQDVEVDVERKQAQAIASLPDSITHYYAYTLMKITVIS